jgi:hypothetical protein
VLKNPYKHCRKSRHSRESGNPARSSDVDPRLRGGDERLTLISTGGPEAHGRSVESRVIPAKAGIQLVLVTWTPAYAGVTNA